MFSELGIIAVTLGRVAHGSGQQLGLGSFTISNDAAVGFGGGALRHTTRIGLPKRLESVGGLLLARTL
jgi:hypothetical protein